MTTSNQQVTNQVFGAHESISGGVFNALDRAKQATCDVVQIFNKSNSQWRAKKLEAKELDLYFKKIDETGIKVCTSHTCYLINIGSSDPELNEKSYQAIKDEMERCELLKIPCLVMHPGAHTGAGEKIGLENIVRNIRRLMSELKDNHVCLLLETTAGQGSTLGHTFEQLAYIISEVDNHPQVGVCMDTCHVFSAGYPITELADYKKTIEQFDSTIGLGRLKIIHMNDSKKGFGEKKDRHEHIGKGHIGLEAFRNIVNDPRLRHIPKIIETPKDEKTLAEDIENLRVLRSLQTI